MNWNRREVLALAATAAAGMSKTRAQGAPEPDWAQWRGPRRDGISTDKGLKTSWPAGGPPKLWEAEGLGHGYSTVALAGNRIYVQGTKDNSSVVFCLNRADGKHVWTAPLGRALSQDRGDGPRGTPTVEGDMVYALSENGDLACLRTRDGSVVWKKNILNDFKGENPHWLISESPLIDGNNLIVCPGGRGTGMVALNKTNGQWVWSCGELSDGAGYSSCIVENIGGVRTIMTLTANAGVGVRANDGKLMWRYERAANRTANCATPVYGDNKVFYTSAYGTGGGLLNLTPQGGAVSAQEAYFTREMQNHHGGVVLYNGHLYGFSNSILTCMEFATGSVKWRDRSVGKGSLTLADGHLYLLGEGHVVGLAEATPEGYREKSRFQIPDRGLPSWAYPVVCGGKLYIRDQGTLTCYNVKA